MLSVRVGPESRPYNFQEADILAISSSGEMAFLLGDVGKGGILHPRAPLAGGAARRSCSRKSMRGRTGRRRGGVTRGHTQHRRRQDRLEYPVGKVIVESADKSRVAAFLTPRRQIAFHGGRGFEDLRSPSWTSPARRRRSSRKVERDCRRTLLEARRKGDLVHGRRLRPPSALYAVELNGRSRLITRVPGNLELDDISRDGHVLANHHTILEIVRGMAPGRKRSGISPGWTALLLGSLAGRQDARPDGERRRKWRNAGRLPAQDRRIARRAAG